MKSPLTTNQLVTIALVAIFLSLFSMGLSFGKFGITGAASTGVGYTNVTVSAATDITVVRAQINFTDSNPGETRDSHDSTQINECSVDSECGINITNDGSVEVNISMENTNNLFDGSSLVNSKHYLYNITFGDNNTAFTSVDCSAGGSRGLQFDDPAYGSFRQMPAESASEVAICYLNSTDGHDSVQVDINITVPGDEPAGIKSGVITFTAIQAIV